MKHVSYYIDKPLFSLVITLTVLSAFFLLLDIDSFTGRVSQSVEIADSCEQTVPSSISCSFGGDGYCADGFTKRFVLDSHGNGFCCCIPPPVIGIIVNRS